MIHINKSLTIRETRSLEKYLQEIGRYKLLNPDQEPDLSRKIRAGDEEAFQTLVNSNLRFVVSVAKQYQHRGLTLSDLISEGNQGLVRAALEFDESRGFKFISFAVWWIRQCITLALAEHSRLIRIPYNKISLINKLNGTIQRLIFENECEPSPEDIAEEMEMDVEEIELLMNLVPRPLSFDTPIDEEEGQTLLDIVRNTGVDETDTVVDYGESLTQEIDRVLALMSETQGKIIRYYFGIGEEKLSLSDIATKMNLSRERVRQIKDKTINKLRCESKSRLLKYFLGR